MDIGQGRWRVAIHFGAAPDAKAVRALAAAAAGPAAAKALRFEQVTAKDWVAESLAGLKPVSAGRFIVHGAHDRAGIPFNRIGIEIEAALAFGTGHHGTTRGCLLALDRLAQKNEAMTSAAYPRSRHRLGVLAIAAARALRQRVLATDVDAVAVQRGATTTRGSTGLARSSPSSRQTASQHARCASARRSI